MDSITIENIERELDGLDHVSSLGSYANPALRRVITGFKYQSATCLAPALVELLRRYKQAAPQTVSIPASPCLAGRQAAGWRKPQGWVIVPVPSSETRVVERGFDHVAMIAELVRRELFPDARVQNILIRRKQTLSNADLEDHDARRGNVLGAFAVVGDVPERILLFDDVITSGATAQECARLLREHGAKEVHAFTLASGG